MTHQSPSDQPASEPSPDELFSALDGWEVTEGDTRWRVEVSAIVDDIVRHRRLIQVILVSGAPPMRLTLSLEAGADPLKAIDALSHWLADPDYADAVVHVS